MDPETLQFVRICAGRIDDGLAPLVAREVVPIDVARICCAELRMMMMRSLGVGAAVACSLPRTLAAIATLQDSSRAKGATA